VIPDGYAIRPLEPDDAEAMATAYHRNQEHLEHWEPARDAGFFTPEGQRDALARQLSLVQGGLLATWVITHSDQVVGRVNLNNIVRGVLQSGSLGYWVDRDHLRRGLATAGVLHACTEAADRLGLHRVEASTMLHNEPSQRVLLNAGFERYGMAPELLFLDGAWRDHYLYQRILHDKAL
jgi:[ribosomal protein S5]-alanine N-acetyltransferase